MEPVDRRGFIKRTSVVAAAAGAAVAIPAAAAGAAMPDGAGRAARVPKDAVLEETVVAHLRDLHDGKIAVFAGEREITITDKRLAALLFNATR